MEQRDNIHFSFQEIDGYNRSINFVNSPREPGKTTAMILDKVYSKFKKSHMRSVALLRNACDASESLIQSYEDIINKFTDDNIKITYSKKDIGKASIFDTFINNQIFIRFIAYSAPIVRIKKTLLTNLNLIFMDEYVCNPKFGEKYAKGECEKFKEIYNTYRRENHALKAYFIGNIYSKYNPYFVGFGIDTNALKMGTIWTNEICAVQFADLHPLLREKLLKENPLYKFDDSYTDYALNGISANDEKIRLAKLPSNYFLKFVFHFEEKYIGIFQNNYLEAKEDKYFVKFIDDVSARRVIYTFDFDNLINKTELLDPKDRQRFNLFKIAIRKRLVEFSEVACYYYVEEIYNYI